LISDLELFCCNVFLPFFYKKLFLIIIGCAIQQLAKKSKLLNLIQTIFLLGKSFAQNDRQFSPFMFCLMWMNPSDWVSQRCKNKISWKVLFSAESNFSLLRTFVNCLKAEVWDTPCGSSIFFKVLRKQRTN